MRCRFAPSTTGPAHPGTLLAALLSYLDARQHNAEFILRLENIDPQRSSSAKEADMLAALSWFGLRWDHCTRQSDAQSHYQAQQALLQLNGSVYPCDCSRKRIQAQGLLSPHGGFAYDGYCRHRTDVNEEDCAWRLRLSQTHFQGEDEAGRMWNSYPLRDFGDPLIRRRDQAFSYQFANIYDDVHQEVTRIVRGHDLLSLWPLQLAIADACGWDYQPQLMHHFLLMEERGDKWSKCHGAIGWQAIASHYDAPSCCGFLAWVANLQPKPEPCLPDDLIGHLDWDTITQSDQYIRWTGEELVWVRDESI